MIAYETGTASGPLYRAALVTILEESPDDPETLIWESYVFGLPPHRCFVRRGQPIPRPECPLGDRFEELKGLTASFFHEWAFAESNALAENSRVGPIERQPSEQPFSGFAFQGWFMTELEGIRDTTASAELRSLLAAQR